jgi:hypothetical protein
MKEKKPETVVLELLEITKDAVKESVFALCVLLIRSTVTVANHICVHGPKLLERLPNKTEKVLDIEYYGSDLAEVATKQ